MLASSRPKVRSAPASSVLTSRSRSSRRCHLPAVDKSATLPPSRFFSRRTIQGGSPASSWWQAAVCAKESTQSEEICHPEETEPFAVRRASERWICAFGAQLFQTTWGQTPSAVRRSEASLFCCQQGPVERRSTWTAEGGC